VGVRLPSFIYNDVTRAVGLTNPLFPALYSVGVRVGVCVGISASVGEGGV